MLLLLLLLVVVVVVGVGGLTLPSISPTNTHRFIAQCHLEGTLPIPPLRAPLIPLPADRLRAEQEDDEEEDDGTGHHRRHRGAREAAAAGGSKKPTKLNVIPFNEQAQRVLAEFLRVTEAGGGEGMKEEEEEEEKVRALLALLKTT